MPWASERLALLSAYVRTLYLAATLRDRAAVDRWQATRIEQLCRHAIDNVEFYRRIGDVPFSQFPIIGKADVMGEFHAFNMLHLSADEAWHRLDHGDALPGYDIGCSTGTTGNRGLFLISDRERFVWLGTIIAKAIPDLWRRHRVVIILPSASHLYSAANESRLLKLHFAELAGGLPGIVEGVERFQPTVVVGPPRILRWMAEQKVAIKPSRMFSAGEVLDTVDREAIERTFALTLGQIYMATEGLFGVTCRHGRLHLAEDAVHFELEPVAGGLVSPIVTDFTRRTQVMARYRMNDLLRLSATPCPCGSPLKAVEEVVGRQDDCFELPCRTGGGRSTITPDVLRNTIIDADRRIDDYRLRQTGPREIELVLARGSSDAAQHAARLALLRVMDRLNVDADIGVKAEELSATSITKLRRVERRWKSASR
jgi:putative adenylate-forming enzyme